jgi:integrase
MLHAIAGYGVRPGEMAALKRALIDWRDGTLTVEQSKTRSVLVLPLAPAPRKCCASTTIGVTGRCSTRPCLPRAATLRIANSSAYAVRHSLPDVASAAARPLCAVDRAAK